MKLPNLMRAVALTLSVLATACASHNTEQPPAASPGSAPASSPPAAATSKAGRAQYISFAGHLPEAVTSFGAVATATHLYTLGGYSGVPHAYVKEDQSGRFLRTNLQTGEVETLASPGRVQGATLEEYQGKLYRVGGLRIDNSAGEPMALRSLADVEVFTPASGQWEALTPLPAPRSSHETVLVGSRLFVVGGWQINGGMDSGLWHEHMLVADLNQRPLRWESVPAPFKVRGLGLAALGAEVYAVGGIVGHAERDATFVFDTRTGQWRSGPRLPEASIGFNAAALNGAIYASGPSGTVYRLAPGDAAWTPVAKLAFPRFFHQMTTQASSRILFAGGIPGDHAGARIRHVEALSATPPSTPWSSWRVPSPLAGKNRQGILLQGNRLYVFGGNKALGQHDFSPDNFLNETFSLDLGSFVWKPLAAFPRKRQSMVTWQHHGNGDQFLALGGFGPEGASLLSHAETFVFDAQANAWTPGPSLPQRRTQFGMAEGADALWVFGGLDYDDRRKGKAAFVHPLPLLLGTPAGESYDFVVTQAALLRERRAFAGAALDGRYYVVGGMREGFQLVDECEVFDLATSDWQPMPCPAQTRLGAELVPLGKRLYLVAGRSRGEDGELAFDRSIEVFDTETGQWTTHEAKLPMSELAHLRVLAFRNHLLMYSAQQTDGHVELTLFDPR